MDPKKKKVKSYAPSDTLSWLSHPTRLLQQPKKSMESNKCIVANDGLKEYSNEKSPQSSTGQRDIEVVATNNIPGMFKADKNTTNSGMKSNNGTCDNEVETRENTTLKSNGSKNKSNRDKKKSAKEIKSKNYEMKCLDLIQNVIIKYKSEDDAFCNVSKKILDLDKTEDSGVKALKYDIVNTLLAVLLDSTDHELKTIQEIIKEMVVPDSLKMLIVSEDCITEYGYLGEGCSSVVLSAFLTKNGARAEVAVKRPRDKAFDKMMISEATLLSQFDHKNIVKMLAFVKDGGPQIALELMELGNLSEAAMELEFSDKNLLTIFIDIAAGMEYMHGKQYLHRDLACRNVFINRRRECKIGDFGLSVYVGNSNGLYKEKELFINSLTLPPETSQSRIFRFQSDVWSMGILIWDLYDDLSPNFLFPFSTKGWILRRFLVDEDKLNQPHRCPNYLFKFVKNQLLNRKFEDRPDFKTIREKMEAYRLKYTELCTIRCSK